MSNLRPLNAKLSRRAQDELNEEPDRVPEDIQKLKDWINKQPHLIARTDDQRLVAFLRGCKYSLEKTKAKIDTFYAMRQAAPEIFKERFVTPQLLEYLRFGGILGLKEPVTEDGPIIVLITFDHYPPDKFLLLDLFKIFTMMIETLMIENDNAVVGGFVEIVDFRGLTASHVMQFTPMIIKKLAILVEKGWPLRPRAFHFINMSPLTEKLIALIRSIVSEKLKRRINIHSDMESLYKVVPQARLPQEYGGNNGSMQSTVAWWEKKLLQYKAHFVEEAHFHTNEKLRPGRSASLDTIYGVDGSFRKLNID